MAALVIVRKTYNVQQHSSLNNPIQPDLLRGLKLNGVSPGEYLGRRPPKTSKVIHSYLEAGNSKPPLSVSSRENSMKTCPKSITTSWHLNIIIFNNAGCSVIHLTTNNQFCQLTVLWTEQIKKPTKILNPLPDCPVTFSFLLYKSKKQISNYNKRGYFKILQLNLVLQFMLEAFVGTGDKPPGV